MAGKRKHDGKARACKEKLKYDSGMGVGSQPFWIREKLFKLLVFSNESACISTN